MSTNATPAIRFSGIGSGIDTNSIVEALMRIERLPIDRIESDKKELKTKQGVVQEINGLLGKLRDASAAMYRPGSLDAKAAKSGDDTIVSASVASAAPSGTFNITVNALASAHTLASGVSPVLTAGQSLDISVGGASVNVAIQAGDDLQKFADRINSTDGVKASASVINNRLVLISQESGTAGQITLGGTAAGALGMAQTQAGQDASATVNGLAVTSSGNVIEGAINGVTLNLSKVGSTTVTVTADHAASLEQAGKFVEAYNAVLRNVKLATSYDAATETAGTLQGDQTMSSLASQLRGIAGSAVTAIATTGYNSLAQVGITSARDGTLTLDQAKFTEAMTADADGVRALFGNDDGAVASTAADGIARRLQAFSNTFSTDILSSRLTGFGTSLGRLDDKIKSLENIMDLKEQRLRAQFQAMERAVSQFQSQGQDLAARLGSL